MSIKLNDSQVKKYAELVHKCIEEEQPNKIIATLCMLTKEERRSIVSYKIDNNPALCFACLQNKPDCVKYLLQECGADIEQKGFYIEPNKNWRIEAPPLWCATVPDDGLEVIKILLEHGADVNGYSNTLSTAVLSACYSQNISAVKYLVYNGADINKPNICNFTCLMNAVGSEELCAYLISKGADLNFVTTEGYTALHFAAQINNVGSVKLLCQHGASVHLKTKSNKTPLNIAAYKGHVDTVEYLLSTRMYTQEDEIEALDLLGCFFVDDDVTMCLKLWQKALIMRSTNLGDSFHAQVINIRPNTALQNAVEIFSIEDLAQLTDPRDMYTQALLKYIRIYGEQHADTISEISCRGVTYAENGSYQRCIELWIYAYQLGLRRDDSLDRDSISSAKNIIAIFCEMERNWESDKTKERMRTEDILTVFKMIVQQISFGKSVLKVYPIDIRDIEEYQCLMQLSLHTIRLFHCLTTSRSEQEDFFGHVSYLIQIDPRGKLNQTLLHLSVNPSITYMGKDLLTEFPSLYVLRILLICGADTRARDDNGHTVLDYSVVYSYSSGEETAS